MDISQHWRLQEQRYGLTGTVCTECDKRFFSPRPICDECADTGMDVYRFGEKRLRRQPLQPVIEPAQR